MANLIALPLLAGTGGGRVIVHRQSHPFNDSGENLSLLGGLTMVPLFPAADLDAIVAIAKRHAIPTFLDGARMLIDAAYTDRTPASLAAPFNIVYLSLYKSLGAPFGCVIAGAAARLDNAFHERRRFGGGLCQMWSAAVLAEDKLDGQLGQWREIKTAGSAVIERLEAERTLTVECVADGTNIVLVRPPGAQLDSAALEQRGRAAGLEFPKPVDGALPIKLNETWLRTDPTELADRIDRVLS